MLLLQLGGTPLNADHFRTDRERKNFKQAQADIENNQIQAVQSAQQIHAEKIDANQDAALETVGGKRTTTARHVSDTSAPTGAGLKGMALKA